MAGGAVPDREKTRALAAALGDRANEMAAGGRAADVPGLWEEAIAGLADEASRDLITLAYAWYQALHGEVEHGVRLAAGLRGSAVSQVRGQIRVLVRNRVRVEPEVVERTWLEVVGTALPPWAYAADEDIDLVVEWVLAASWEESAALFAGVDRIASQAVDAALEEMGLGDPRAWSTVNVHRAIVVLGGQAGYRSVGDAQEAARVATAAIEARDWEALRACGTIERKVHGRAFLGGTHGVAADLMTGGDLDVSPALAERVAELAQDAEPWERERALADLTAIGDGPVGALLGLLDGIL